MSAPYSKETAEMIRAVEYVVPAIEIADSRVANWDIRIWDTVADNASSGLFVLGAVPRKLDGLDLRECGMVMEIKGEPISVGAGIACIVVAGAGHGAGRPAAA